MRYILSLALLLSFVSCSKKETLPLQKKEINYTSTVSPEFLKTLNFKGKELIAVPMGKHFYYVHKSGKKIMTLTYDNGADAFQDGLARTRVQGKIGFFNRNLEMVLPPIYDFAFPFHKGIAEICTGCQEKKDGEYHLLDGGKWKKIDRNGLIIE